MHRSPPQISLATKVLYSCGQAVDSISGAVLGFLLFYLTAACGLPPTLAGLLLGLTLVFDAFVDPLVGSLSDNARSSWGRRHVFMFAGLPPILLGLVLLFSVPGGLHGPALVPAILCSSLLLRIGQSAFNVPYAALGAELSDDYAQRTRITVWRMLIGAPAGVFTTLLGYNFFLSGKLGLFDRAAYVPFACVAAIVLFVLGLASTIGTLGAGKSHTRRESEVNVLQRLAVEIKEASQNRSFLRIFLAILIILASYGTAGALGLHAAKFFWNLSQNMLSILTLFGAVGGLLGLLLSSLLAPVIEKRSIVLIALVYAFTTQAALPLLRIWGFLPDGAMLYVILAANSFAMAAVGAACVVAFTSMMADATDEHELAFGTRREGLFFAATSFAAKASAGVGTFLGGIILDLAHLPVHISEMAGIVTHIAPAASDMLGLLSGVVPAVLSTAGLFVIAGYRLDRNRHAHIQAELANRRGMLTK